MSQSCRPAARSQLSDVDGAVEARTMSGALSPHLNPSRPTSRSRFATTSGDVELEIKPDFDADLKAETMSGDIEIDDEASGSK